MQDLMKRHLPIGTASSVAFIALTLITQCLKVHTSIYVHTNRHVRSNKPGIFQRLRVQMYLSATPVPKLKKRVLPSGFMVQLRPTSE